MEKEVCIHNSNLTPETCAICIKQKGEKLPIDNQDDETKLHPNLLVVKMVRDAGLDIKAFLRQGVRTREYSDLKDKILSELQANHPELSQQNLGQLLNLSPAAISQRLSKIKMASDWAREDEAATQVCKDPDCESNGEPQPVDTNFQIHGPSQKPLEICKECMARRFKNGIKKKSVKKPEPNKKKKAAPATIPSDCSLVIDFSKFPDVLKKIRSVAYDEVRTPEGQVLYWLKEFSLLQNQKTEKAA